MWTITERQFETIKAESRAIYKLVRDTEGKGEEEASKASAEVIRAGALKYRKQTNPRYIKALVVSACYYPDLDDHTDRAHWFYLSSWETFDETETEYKVGCVNIAGVHKVVKVINKADVIAFVR